jgi:polyphosphate kinase
MKTAAKTTGKKRGTGLNARGSDAAGLKISKSGRTDATAPISNQLTPGRRSGHVSAQPPAAAKLSQGPASAPKAGGNQRIAPRYYNRDESWLLFNRRVLEEARDVSNPLLERMKFLSITASNLDEFVEIRVASVLQQFEEQQELPQKTDENGLTLRERLTRLSEALHSFHDEQAKTWNQNVAPALAGAAIRLLRWKQLNDTQRRAASRFFHDEVDPMLTPVTIDPSHPFPRVLNKAMSLALLLQHKRKGRNASQQVLGVVTIPRSLPGVLALPEREGRADFILLDELIGAHIEKMFRGYRILSRATFRVTRNSNLYMEEEESRSVLESVREELHNRRKGDVVRMEIEAAADEEIVERLRVNFELDPWQVFRIDAPVNFTRTMDVYSAIKRPELKFSEFHGQRIRLTDDSDIFSLIRQKDILLHHPFDSYNTVEAFIEGGTLDPRVISIRQTLYRTSADSTIFRALKEAGATKDVTVVVELMARFDEASNIRWARELEDAGVQVFHGIFGLKTHCKLSLLIRRDPDGAIRSYAHLGTGNYNPVTSRFYTDISLLTCRHEITEAVQNVFRYLTADWAAGAKSYRPLQVAPLTLAADVRAQIERETAHARAGRPARIIAKMNALLDYKTIEPLYAASQAGVEIDLIVRGMCTLRAGVPGLSERIRVRSIVGRFLEHSRIFWFANGGEDEVYAGSADWMPRNLYERCEVVFPVLDPDLKRRLRDEILEAYLRDNVKARLLKADGTYVRAPRSGASFSAQDWLMQLAQGQSETAAQPPAVAARDATPRRSPAKRPSAPKAELGAVAAR